MGLTIDQLPEDGDPLYKSPAYDDLLARRDVDETVVRAYTKADTIGDLLNLGRVETIAALKAVDVTKIPDGLKLTVLGSATAGDNGGGDYYYDATSSATDNGVTIVTPDAGAGRWLRVSYMPKIEVATVAALGALSVTAFTVGDIAVVRDFATSGDGGFGFFELKSTSATAVAGMIIDSPTAGKQWHRKFDGDLNPRWFGARGNGTTNDRTAIQAAEDYAQSTGRHLVFPAGTYLVNGYVAKKAGVKWRGTGKLKADSSVTNHFPLVYAENVDGWEIVGLSFENLVADSKTVVNSAAVNRNACISIKNCDNWRVESCVMRKFTTAVFYSDCKRFIVRGNDIDADLGKTLESLEDRTITYVADLDGSGGIVSDQQTGTTTPNSEDGIISDNVIIATGLDTGINVCTQAWGRTPIIVANNHVRGSKAGIQCYTGTLGDPGNATTFQRRVIIQGNRVEDTWETGIYIRAVFGVLCTGNLIARTGLNNVINNSGTTNGAIVTRVSGFELTITSPVSLDVGHVITNNLIIDTGAVDQGGQAGIQVRIEGCTVKGNVIRQSAERYGATSGKLVYGVYVASNAVRFDISDNVIQNATTGIRVSRTTYTNSDTKAQRIAGNYIDEVTTGISCDEGKLLGCTIQGNTICRFTSRGIRVRQTQNSVIRDNVIRDGTGSAIGIEIAGGTFNTDFRGFNSRVGPTNVIVGNVIDSVTTAHAVSETTPDDTSFLGRCLYWEDIVNGQKAGKNYRDTVPTTGNRYSWFRGEQVFRVSSASSGKIGQVCVQSGTHGTINAGTVADTTSGSTTITMTSGSAVAVNSYIAIAGVSGVKKVTAINGDTITLDSTCDATVSGAAVAFSAPVFKDWGAIDA